MLITFIYNNFKPNSADLILEDFISNKNPINERVAKISDKRIK
ncbi:hypothetical protein [Flexistipes sinusarabici]|nr:hypothetical protein [Flexistipes sinusarabici]